MTDKKLKDLECFYEILSKLSIILDGYHNFKKSIKDTEDGIKGRRTDNSLLYIILQVDEITRTLSGLITLVLHEKPSVIQYGFPSEKTRFEKPEHLFKATRELQEALRSSSEDSAKAISFLKKESALCKIEYIEEKRKQIELVWKTVTQTKQ